MRQSCPPDTGKNCRLRLERRITLAGYRLADLFSRRPSNRSGKKVHSEVNEPEVWPMHARCGMTQL